MSELVIHRARHSAIGDLARLIKLRSELLVLFATAAGFCLASGGRFECGRMMGVLLGTGLVAGAAGVLNQVFEKHGDARMARTRDRPLPAGRVSKQKATALGAAMAGGGLGVLALGTTLAAAALAAVTLVLYLGVYTPLKKRTPLCIGVGAIAGALPPVIGWAAWDGSLGMQTGILFGVLFAWQIPHVLAIAWMHRHDYAAAGLEMLPRGDTTGRAAASWALAFSGVLIAITLIPAFNHTLGMAYLSGALLLNGVFATAAVRFLRARSTESARGLFVVSIGYLPLWLVLMAVL